MRIAYFDCFAGLSGDMTLGALLEVGVDAERLEEELRRLPLPEIRLEVRSVQKAGLAATAVAVIAPEPQPRRCLADIVNLLENSPLSPWVKEHSSRVFHRLAEVEAKIHRTTPERVHFHEVGAIDAIADVVGALLGLEWLGVEQVYASPLPFSRGFVECAHGTLPVPAPAVAELLRGIPTVPSPVSGETVTPTGAAIITTIASQFGPPPPFTPEVVGYGAGKRDQPIPNVLRLFLGEMAAEVGEERLILLETNLDDLNPELYTYVQQRLFAAGAADVYFTPIQMKKNRPAVLLSVLAPPERAETLSEILFLETSTLGLRWLEVRRRHLEREWVRVETPFGPVEVKIGRLGGRVVNLAPEYESCRAAAEAHRVPLQVVYDAARALVRDRLGYEEP